MSDDKKDLILQRVRAMLAKADSTEFEGEAEVFRAKADALMTKYTIEQWQLDAADDVDAAGREPQRRDVNISWYWDPAYDHLKLDMFTLFSNVAKHCRCKVIWWNTIEQRDIPVLGLLADLDYFDLLFTHLQIQLSAKLTPGVEKGDSYIEALVRMKEAGMRWEAIGERLINAGLMDGPYTRNVGVRFTKEYTEYCKETNRERKYINPKTYQRSFAEGFREQVSARLRAQKQEQAEEGGTGMELVLRDISQLLDETATDMFGRQPRGGTVSRDLARDKQGYGSGSHAGREANISGNPQRSVKGTRGELTS
jgi:hypothetical protein